MGGHSAWKKRVATGGIAKGAGGAIARHRPRWGRKGEDLKLNRKGNIAGGNPKKTRTKKTEKERSSASTKLVESPNVKSILVKTLVFILMASVAAMIYAALVRA